MIVTAVRAGRKITVTTSWTRQSSSKCRNTASPRQTENRNQVIVYRAIFVRGGWRARVNSLWWTKGALAQPAWEPNLASPVGYTHVLLYLLDGASIGEVKKYIMCIYVCVCFLFGREKPYVGLRSSSVAQEGEGWISRVSGGGGGGREGRRKIVRGGGMEAFLLLLYGDYID